MFIRVEQVISWQNSEAIKFSASRTSSPGEVRTNYLSLKRQTNLVDAQDSEHKTAACRPSAFSV